ncbi:MAG: translation initiation factor IF-3 [Oscillospiraceae bacterium]|nr:translation initiation factor IF-3 [Oscillospiraceae bacterium]
MFNLIGNKNLEVNQAIKDKELRVIGQNGEQLGVMPLKEAFEIASHQGLDLVKVAPKASPPVCRIVDYGKYCFDQSKKYKEARKKQHILETKEIRISSKIDIHDFDTKVSHAVKFLKNGNKVKISLRFRGREIGHFQVAHRVMKKFAEACSEFGTVEKPAKVDGRSMFMFLSSNVTSDQVKIREKKNAENKNTQRS